MLRAAFIMHKPASPKRLKPHRPKKKKKKNNYSYCMIYRYFIENKINFISICCNYLGKYEGDLANNQQTFQILLQHYLEFQAGMLYFLLDPIIC